VLELGREFRGQTKGGGKGGGKGGQPSYDVCVCVYVKTPELVL
jgi:hypothetical protein